MLFKRRPDFNHKEFGTLMQLRPGEEESETRTVIGSVKISAF